MPPLTTPQLGSTATYPAVGNWIATSPAGSCESDGIILTLGACSQAHNTTLAKANLPAQLKNAITLPALLPKAAPVGKSAASNQLRVKGTPAELVASLGLYTLASNCSGALGRALGHDAVLLGGKSCLPNY